MKEFQIEKTSVLKELYIVEAETLEEALEEVHAGWHDATYQQYDSSTYELLDTKDING